MKPRIFIASSSEHLDIAESVQQQLQRDADSTIWNQDIFRLSRNTIDELIRALDDFDFGIFVFTPDDEIAIREQRLEAPRDNVVFELGLFMGRLGKERTFVIRPTDADALRWLSDLAGFTPAMYETRRYREEPRAALGPACTEIKNELRRSFLPKPGIYIGYRRERLGVGWRPYSGYAGMFDVYRDDIHLYGETAGGLRYPPKDNLGAPWQYAVVRIQRDTPAERTSVHLVLRHQDRSKTRLVFSTKVKSVGWIKSEQKAEVEAAPKFGLPLGHLPADKWFSAVFQVQKHQQAIGRPIECIDGLRLKSPLRLSHILFAEQEADIPDLLKRDAVRI